MNTRILQIIFAFSFVVMITGCNKTSYEIKSPNGNISVQLKVTEKGHVNYSIQNNLSDVILPSDLGMIRSDADFYNNLSIKSISQPQFISEQYQLNNGKEREISYTANEAVLNTQNKNGKLLQIVFRVSDDGVAFRYIFPEQSDDEVMITEEKTTYHFPDNTKGFLQPTAKAKSGWCETNPSYEEYYKIGIAAGTSSPTKAGWVYPALFNNEQNWIAITEAALNRNYCATRLSVTDSINSTYQVTFPNPEEVLPNGELLPNFKLPYQTPWRVLSIGSLKTVVESTLGTDLADPAIYMDFSFVKPGFASWSWIILKDDNIIYDVQKDYIDFAANMKWEYCLVDVNWDNNIGYEKMQELVDYANGKGVGVILWYNSSGDWNSTTYTPKSKLLTSEQRTEEFARLQKMGVKGIKVDFFGGDGQSVIAYYHDIITDAAKYGLMVNCHGATLPRGWQRTYPNLVTVEAVRVFENVTFNQEEADHQPVHCTMQPFTRNLFDPMDYTPVNLTKVPNIERRTLPGFELALPVIFQSGIQHMAETPTGMNALPQYVKEFLGNCPATWDETKFIEGYPGKYVVLARRSGDQWYIGGINAQDKAQEINLDLSFVSDDQQHLITDDSNDIGLSLKNIILDEKNILRLEMKSKGGFVIY